MGKRVGLSLDALIMVILDHGMMLFALDSERRLLGLRKELWRGECGAINLWI